MGPERMESASAGYLRFPHICGETVAFVSEDDLWLVPADGGRAWRLTAGVAELSHPRVSPDGEQVAFIGREEGPGEVFVLSTAGGPSRRLTYAGARRVVGWTSEGSEDSGGSEPAIVYASDHESAFAREPWLYRIPAEGGPATRLPYGPAYTVSRGPGGAAVIGRNNEEPARWKRYRGGTAGDLWVDTDGNGEFGRLVDLDGNLAHPCWLGDRIYFVSDHEGVGNIYSVTPDGADVRRHTDHDVFYARNLSGDGARLVYHCAGDLYLLDPAQDGPRRIEVHTGSARTQRSRKFVPAAGYLDQATLGPDGSDLALTTRGKAFSLAHWEGPVRQHGEPDGVRYRLLHWLPDHRRLVAVMGDESVEERLVVLTADGSAEPRIADGLDLGQVRELAPSPHSDVLALTNHRGELSTVDLAQDAPQLRQLDRSEFGEITDVAWAPDGRWIAYSKPRNLQQCLIMLARVDTGETHEVTRPVLVDDGPAFDPEGRYLYFLGQRDFDPVYDSLQFDAGFPLGSRPYAVSLRSDVGSPFVPEPRPLVSEAAATQRKAEDEQRTQEQEQTEQQEKGQQEKADGAVTPVEIDVDGLADRVIAFPVQEGRYRKVAGVKGKVLFTRAAVRGALEHSPFDGEDEGACTLEAYDFETQKVDRLVDGVDDFGLDRTCQTLLYRAGKRLRVLKAGEKPPEEGEGDAHGSPPYGRNNGWIDLDRVKVSVRPGAEWRQMVREAWRLQRDHFWAADMSGHDWEALYARYLPLVDRVASRAELSDLFWELQGELGTSHAYEIGGEYRPGPDYRQGFLGVDWRYDSGSGRFHVERVLQGDSWKADATSPLNRPGVDVRTGDAIVAINGQPVGRRAGGTAVSDAVAAGSSALAVTMPGEPLVNQAGEEIQLTVVRGDEAARTVSVRAIGDERSARYRDWVEANRASVHERTGGRVGYLHIPNMGPWGYGEFHRGFLVEYDREALIIDVRFNGGGNVSALLLEKLERVRLGYDFPRWTPPEPYPGASPRGPLVALTNEHAGSDGDIFCHAFKLRKLGTLVGKRTWGGVIGISPSHALVDGTITTQPEFSFAFDDVGWGVENYGTDPDIDVDRAPQDHAHGRDPQLDRAIAVAVSDLTARPAHTPQPLARPRLAPSPLPPRP